MRVHIITSANTELVPFDYQQKLTGVVHKWLGKNNIEHGKISLYSFSWLHNGVLNKDGINFPGGAKWFISFYDIDKVKIIINSILADPEMFSGMFVSDITIEETPDLSLREQFFVASPILIKRFVATTYKETHYTFNDCEANDLMKETLVNKIKKAGLTIDDTLDIKFDYSYANKKMKLMTYKGIKNKANLCPIIIKCRPEIKAFAWNVGIGNSTGIGFGSIY